MRRMALISLVALAMIAASCGGEGSDAASQGATDGTQPSTTALVTTTIPDTTTVAPTTTAPPTTTTTRPPTPQELRNGFLTALESAGWKMHADEVVGWSIRYPGDWEVIADEPGGQVIFVPPVEGGVLTIMPSLDPAKGDESSDDYLTGNVVSSVEQGLLREPQDDDWFWLDADFNGVQGAQDIVGAELVFAIDPTTGETLADDELAPVWWYGYYDPETRPSYGYVMQTFGVSPLLFQYADDIFMSFEPPGGYPPSD